MLISLAVCVSSGVDHGAGGRVTRLSTPSLTWSNFHHHHPTIKKKEREKMREKRRRKIKYGAVANCGRVEMSLWISTWCWITSWLIRLRKRIVWGGGEGGGKGEPNPGVVDFLSFFSPPFLWFRLWKLHRSADSWNSSGPTPANGCTLTSGMECDGPSNGRREMAARPERQHALLRPIFLWPITGRPSTLSVCFKVGAFRIYWPIKWLIKRNWLIADW